MIKGVALRIRVRCMRLKASETCSALMVPDEKKEPFLGYCTIDEWARWDARIVCEKRVDDWRVGELQLDHFKGIFSSNTPPPFCLPYKFPIFTTH